MKRAPRGSGVRQARAARGAEGSDSTGEARRAAEAGWDRVEAFLAVASTGSLSAAARSLGLAQPTVRRSVAALERHLGVVLFSRGTHGLLLTEEGREAVVHAEAMQAASWALTRAVSGAHDRVEGRVRVTASRVVATEVLPAVLEPLLRRHPLLTIEVVATNAIEDLLRQDADVAIRMTRPKQQALVTTRIGSVPIGLFAHRGYVDTIADTPPWTKARLASMGWVFADRDTAMARVLAEQGIQVPSTAKRLRSDDDVVQLAAIRAGLGVGAVQLAIAARDADLVDVVPSLRVNLEAWLVTHQDLLASRRVRVVFDHLRDALRTYWSGSTEDVGPRPRQTLAKPGGAHPSPSPAETSRKRPIRGRARLR